MQKRGGQRVDSDQTAPSGGKNPDRQPRHSEIRSVVSVVRAVGLEPTRRQGLRILSPICLPFHHARISPVSGAHPVPDGGTLTTCCPECKDQSKPRWPGQRS